MVDGETNFIRNWIYSYLKYGGVATQAQRERSKAKFLAYLEENKDLYQTKPETNEPKEQ